MNVIARSKPEAEIGIDEPQARYGISAEERARRKAAVDYARGGVRLEGFVASPFAEDLNRRYIECEITRQEMTGALFAAYTTRAMKRSGARRTKRENSERFRSSSKPIWFKCASANFMKSQSTERSTSTI